MNTVTFFSLSLLPSSPYRNVFLFSNRCAVHGDTIKKEGRLINGDFKVVMHSTDTNNCGETGGKRRLWLLPYSSHPLTDTRMHSCTHADTRTHVWSTHTCEHIGTQTFKEFTYGTVCTITRVAVHVHIDTNLNPMDSLEAFGTDSSPTTGR